MYSESRIPRKYRLAPDIEITTLEARIPIRQMGLDPAYGCYTWPSAVVLAHWCLRSRFRVTGRSVLELGAGTGLAGLACSLCGASAVTLSDAAAFPAVLENLQRTIDLNCAGACPVRVAAVSWGLFPPDLLSADPPELILAADCLYHSQDFDAFFATVTFLLEKQRACGGRGSLVTAYQHRSSHRCLEWLLDRWGLECICVTPAEMVLPSGVPLPREAVDVVELRLRESAAG